MRVLGWLVVVVLVIGAAACSTSTPSGTTTTSGAQSTLAPTTRVPTSTSSPDTAAPTTSPPTTSPPTTVTPSTTPPTTAVVVPAVKISDGVVAGPESIAAVLGGEVLFTVTSDVADEVHVHGYDLTFDLEPGVAMEIRFTADVPGVFEVELHGSHQSLVDLTVEP